MAKLRMTLIVDYTTGATPEEDQNAYGTTDPIEMAAIDQENLEEDTLLMVQSLIDWDFDDKANVVKRTIEPVVE